MATFKIGFEAPGTVREVVDLLNRTGRWELTLVDAAGRVYGHYQTEIGTRQVPTPPGQVILYNGEVDDPNSRPFLIVDSDEAAVAFLYGCFLGAFGGKSLEAIQDDLIRHRNERFL